MKIQKGTYFSRGFSLIELLVTVSIIGILAVILMTTLTTQRTSKEVDGAAFQVSAKIREAQTAALTGKQYASGTTPCAYRVAWGGSQITHSYVYKDGSGNCTLFSTIDALNLSNGVVFSGTGSADFTLPHGQVASNQALTLQKSTNSKAVCIRTNGLIDVQPTAGSC